MTAAVMDRVLSRDACYRENAELRAENEDLKFTIKELLEGPEAEIALLMSWGLTSQEARLVSALYNAPFGLRNWALHARVSGESSDARIINTIICKIHRKTSGRIVIKAARFEGRRLSNESRERIRAALAEVSA